MTLLRLFFSGQIKKAVRRDAGGKPLVEVSLCKKHKGRNGADDTFTWAKISLWEPAEFQVPRLIKGALISGSGDVQLRSYVAKDGTKGASLEIRCSSYDVEVEAGPQDAPASPAIQHHAEKPYDSSSLRAKEMPAETIDEPPF